VTGVDPTIGLRVEGTTGSLVLCPLTPLEAQRLRAAGRTRPGDTVRPAAVTIALLGGSHGEIAAALISDVDFLGGRLRLGRGTTGDRWVALDGIGGGVLQERLAVQKRAWRRRGQPWNPHSVPLAMPQPLSAYPPSSVAPSVSMSLLRALHRAGVTRAGVRPRSVREFAANRTYALTRRVEDVAQQLGLSSLDTAAHFVDHAWQDRWGDVIRASAGSGG
jgi:integrase